MNNRSEGVSMNTWWLAAAGLVLLAILIVGTIINYNGGLQSTESRLGSVLENPDQYYGRRIDVVGDVDQVIGVRAFTIDTPQPLSDKLLVISRQPIQPIGGGPDEYLYKSEDRVEVMGEVREFRLRAMERALGMDLSDEEFRSWEGKPVMIADEIRENR